jgi:cyclohexanone monooxygenase
VLPSSPTCELEDFVPSSVNETSSVDYDVLVVGAGFAGMLAVKRCLDNGLSVLAIESGDDVGGTWYWNRYPGARCDIRSAEYSYSFDEHLEQEWVWSERFAAQPEILAYAQHVADRFALRDHIAFETTVVSAAWEPGARSWRVQDHRGVTRSSRYCIWAMGPLSVPKPPDIPGVETFAGDVVVTGSWPRRPLDLGGRRVGVIGTGSSGIQTITHLAPVVDELYVFQRTPSFSLPAQNHAIDAVMDAEIKRSYRATRERARTMPNGQDTFRSDIPLLELSDEERKRMLDEQWARGGIGLQAMFPDVMLEQQANDVVADYVRTRIREIVEDPTTAEALLPQSHPIGSRRVCIDVGYYETYNRENVHLVDLRRTPLVAVDHYDVDVIVLATGFDAMTGPFMRVDISNGAGETLAHRWADGPETFLGLLVSGFPNMFLVNGPGSPSVMMNMILAIEHHVEWILDVIKVAEDGHQVVSADRGAESRWTRHVSDLAQSTLFSKADSWYQGTNVQGKPKVFLPYVGGFPRYVKEVEHMRQSGFEGLDFRGTEAAPGA